MLKKTMGTRGCKFTPNLVSLIACFSRKNKFFVKFLTFVDVLVIFSTSMPSTF